ncbi:MAG: YidC/Oxa1 family membrane protein insertase [Clostridiales bacterium]|nr:YidC/Oxa1 family membrane protein insertase [Clostridiales bacterium]
MLSHLHIMEGVSFLCIGDLSVPDGLIGLGQVRVNLLPVLMTLINIISGMVYSKERSAREKIQIYGLAAIFLVLLYTSPSGLVLYWTVNNIFSLFKNIVASVRSRYAKDPVSKEQKEPFAGNAVSFASLLFLAVFTGVYIPSDIINSSVVEFSERGATDPSRFIAFSFCLAAGAFILWMGVIRYLLTPRGKDIFSVITISAVFVAVTDFMMFFDVSRYTPRLVPDDGYKGAELSSIALNITVVAMIVMLTFILLRNRTVFFNYVVYILVAVVAFMGVKNVIGIHRAYGELSYIKEQEAPAEFKLSTGGRNVVVIMMDRAAGFFVPYIFNEIDGLKDEYDGFVFYPNTLSTGAFTNSGSPGVYGGYGYTSAHMVERDGLITTESVNNALRVMPVNFGDSGFEVTVSDPSYANMKWIPDLSIYEDHPEFHTYITEGKYLGDDAGLSDVLERNLFCYGLYRVSPLFVRDLIFDNGLYNESNREYSNKYSQTITGDYSAIGYDECFMDSYTVLEALPSFTTIVDDDSDQFLMFVNYTAHDFALISEPEYAPSYVTDNSSYEQTERSDGNGNTLILNDADMDRFYSSNAAAFRELTVWFDYLRENGVYDNTRIIIVSDHAYSLDERYRFFNPVLFVKDFDSHGFTVDEQFMTNADTPLIAMEGLVESPTDPYYGTPVTDETKYDLPYHIIYNYGDICWYSFEGDVRDESSFTAEQ